MADEPQINKDVSGDVQPVAAEVVEDVSGGVGPMATGVIVDVSGHVDLAAAEVVVDVSGSVDLVVEDELEPILDIPVAVGRATEQTTQGGANNLTTEDAENENVDEVPEDIEFTGEVTPDEWNHLAFTALDKYFDSNPYFISAHHIDSYDQFIREDMTEVIKQRNPIRKMFTVGKGAKRAAEYPYEFRMYIGGRDGTAIYAGRPTMDAADLAHPLFPNEARARRVTYAAPVFADITIDVYVNFPTLARLGVTEDMSEEDAQWEEGDDALEVAENAAANDAVAIANAESEAGSPESIGLAPTIRPGEDKPFHTVEIKQHLLFYMPIMLHSKLCLLRDTPAAFRREAGECEYDQGGYFIIDGQEKVLVTRQEQSFNTIHISHKSTDDIPTKATITTLTPGTREKRFVGVYMANEDKGGPGKGGQIYVQMPMIRLPVPLFVVFRAMGFQTDEEIVRCIFSDMESSEAQKLIPLLMPSIYDASPFFDQQTSVQYLSTLTKRRLPAMVIDVLNNMMFTHITNHNDTTDTDKTVAGAMMRAKGYYLGHIVRRLLRVNQGLEQATDKDDTRNQRVYVAGGLLQRLFGEVYNEFTKKMLLKYDETYNVAQDAYQGAKFVDLLANYTNQTRLIAHSFITDALLYSFRGKWGMIGKDRTVNQNVEGVLQALSRLTYLDFISHTRRVVLDFDTTRKLVGPRRMHPSQFGFFCAVETPGGASIGIVKNLAIMTRVSSYAGAEPIVRWLFARGSVVPIDQTDPIQRSTWFPVTINNEWIGVCRDPLPLVAVMKLMKWSGCLAPLVSVTFSFAERALRVYTDEGRPARPVWHMHPNFLWNKYGRNMETDEIDVERFPRSVSHEATWDSLVSGSLPEGVHRGDAVFVDPLAEMESPTLGQYADKLLPHCGMIEYIDPYEQHEAYIAWDLVRAAAGDFTHCEIHPSTMLGIVASCIPFLNHNQAPRNHLSCAQSKQSVSLYATSFRHRFDTFAHVLSYPQMPLAATYFSRRIADGKIQYATNAIVALASYTGYNQEDGILFNKTSVERGMFRSLYYRSYTAMESVDRMTGVEMRVGNPTITAEWTSLKPGRNYSKLDERGIIKLNEYVDDTTVLVGCYAIKVDGTNEDASLMPSKWTDGYVDDVLVTANSEGHMTVKVRIRNVRVPEIGDKYSNRHGQKGTTGMLIPAADMPRCRNGIVPDVIVNPHSIPSRMTMAQLLEAVGGKAAACHGALLNATAFSNVGSPAELFGDALEEAGYERYGNEILYSGITGEMMEVAIFITPTYYMRLKHMPIDKMNARAEGRRMMRTHQPTGGRGNQGGLRIGEMERDVIVAHGSGAFQTESMMKRGDEYETVVCDGCGTIPIYNKSRGLYVCPMCEGPLEFAGDTEETLRLVPPVKPRATGFSTIKIPYTLKLTVQELETIGNQGFRFLTSANMERFTHGSQLGRIRAIEEGLPAVIEAAEAMATPLDGTKPLKGLRELYRLPEAPVHVMPTIEEEETPIIVKRRKAVENDEEDVLPTPEETRALANELAEEMENLPESPVIVRKRRVKLNTEPIPEEDVDVAPPPKVVKRKKQTAGAAEEVRIIVTKIE